MEHGPGFGQRRGKWTGDTQLRKTCGVLKTLGTGLKGEGKNGVGPTLKVKTNDGRKKVYIFIYSAGENIQHPTTTSPICGLQW